METRAKPRGAKAPLTIDVALAQIRRDKAEIEEKLRLSSPALTAANIRDIESEVMAVMRKNARRYSKYDIAHAFVSDHVVDALRSAIALTAWEEKLVRKVMGRIHSASSITEYLDIAAAAAELSQRGRRATVIFQAFGAEANALNSAVGAAHTRTDMFHKPSGADTLLFGRDFAGVRDFFLLLRNNATEDGPYLRSDSGSKPDRI